MKGRNKCTLLVVCILSVMFLVLYNPWVSIAAQPDKKIKAVKTDPIDKWQAKPNASCDASHMGDMSDFDPSTVDSPTGDTIKIAIVAAFSGPSALNGALYWLNTQWVAWDINKRGGIFRRWQEKACPDH